MEPPIYTSARTGWNRQYTPVLGRGGTADIHKCQDGVETPLYTSARTGWNRRYTQVPGRGGNANIHKVPGRGGTADIHKCRDGVETPIFTKCQDGVETPVYTSAETGWNRQYTESRYLTESTLFTLQGFSIVKFHPPKLRKFHPP